MMQKFLSTIYLPFNYAVRFAINWSSYPSKCRRSKEEKEKKEKEEPIGEILCAMFAYLIMTLFGYLNDTLDLMFPNTHGTIEKNRDGYVPLYSSFENFYRRNIYSRISATISIPIASIAAMKTLIMERTRETYRECDRYKLTGKLREVINFVSYNYLEMNQNKGTLAENVKHIIYRDGVVVSGPLAELGTTVATKDLEEKLSQFLGVESSFIVGQGFATNATIIPAIVNEGRCLILTDELNHTSIAMGCKLSSTATVARFKHNDMEDLEENLQYAIYCKKFDKILIIVEGIYSMEGTVVNLPEVMRLKKKYKAYLYIDEAHSIGALGARGRGVCDYFNVDPRDVDILMGTFTKSFGASGGYVSGNRRVIDHVKSYSHSYTYATPMAPAIIEQISSVIKIISDGDDDGTSVGRKKLEKLAANVKYFRAKLRRLGFLIYGHDASAVVPLMTFSPTKALNLSLKLLERKIGAPAVGFPATELTRCRIRFCLSSGHTKEMMDTAIDSVVQLSEVCDIFRVKECC